MARLLSVVVDAMRHSDYERVADIYRAGIDTGNATFETEAPTWARWDASHLSSYRSVARIDGDIVGWAAVSAVSDRCAYEGVVEVSVYVAPEAQGAGVGKALLQETIRSTEAGGVWTLQAQMFPENSVSIALHEKLGFRRVGVRERVGQLDGRWRDVVLFERRSPVVGVT